MENHEIEDSDNVVTEPLKPAAGPESANQDREAETSIIEELNNKYVRLYAEFDNYKKRVSKDKEEILKYGNESLLYELLPAIDNLELALKHATGDLNSGLVQGVEMTLKELHRTLDKFGLTKIEAAGKEFDPAVHHAMMQVEREDMAEKMVAEELRAGYLYREKVLRPSLVSVSVRPKKTEEAQVNQASDEEASGKVNIRIIDKKEEKEEA